MDTALLNPEMMNLLDGVEAQLIASFPPVECPVTHRFVPGLYCREIFMPAGTVVTSKIHKTQHFYIILEGSGIIHLNGKAEPYEASGKICVTEPGTRRAIAVLTDTRWATFHVHDSQDLGEIENDIIEKYDNPLLVAQERL
jgi:mannose-6-phosphate isomerase-like protein (cupin superfamily)